MATGMQMCVSRLMVAVVQRQSRWQQAGHILMCISRVSDPINIAPSSKFMHGVSVTKQIPAIIE